MGSNFVRCLVVVALSACVACTSPTSLNAQTAIEPPACTTVTQFGNGQTCSSADAMLKACGTNASRLCAGGWLCYDAPELEQCTCTADSDCDGKRAYVSQARALNDKQPISVTCHGGRCVEGL